MTEKAVVVSESEELKASAERRQNESGNAGSNPARLFHWTDEDGLRGILTEMSINEGTSFTDSYALPFDTENGCPYGILVDIEWVLGLGCKRIPANSLGVTLLELEHEWVCPVEIDALDAVLGFIVRTPQHKRDLERILNEWDFEESITVIGK